MIKRTEVEIALDKGMCWAELQGANTLLANAKHRVYALDAKNIAKVERADRLLHEAKASLKI